MRDQIIKTHEIPENVAFNSTFEILSNDVSYFTHGFFKYPCKFIPHIPRWAILKYTKEKQIVLDPFAGSGTTLVEAVLNNRNALGVDFDKLSQLLCRAKTKILSNKQKELLYRFQEKLLNKDNASNFFKPDIHNMGHWFSNNNVKELLNIKAKIEEFYATTKDEKTYNLLLVCFASIIKKCSYADDASPKPYVSKRIPKKPLSAKALFLKTLKSYTKSFDKYKVNILGKIDVISDDARDIRAPRYKDKVSLSVTSPPYINAFDYVRSLRLENAWLGYYGDSDIREIKKKQIGTETISSYVYKKGLSKTGNKRLDSVLNKIWKIDKKRAFVVFKFFEDLGKNFVEVKKLLKKDAHYVIVVGDSKIRGIIVPTHEILIDIARRNGYRLENMFSYVIKNRYLRIPRSGRGGLIKKDWVLDLVNING